MVLRVLERVRGNVSEAARDARAAPQHAACEDRRVGADPPARPPSDAPLAVQAAPVVGRIRRNSAAAGSAAILPDCAIPRTIARCTSPAVPAPLGARPCAQNGHHLRRCYSARAAAHLAIRLAHLRFRAEALMEGLPSTRMRGEPMAKATGRCDRGAGGVPARWLPVIESGAVGIDPASSHAVGNRRRRRRRATRSQSASHDERSAAAGRRRRSLLRSSLLVCAAVATLLVAGPPARAAARAGGPTTYRRPLGSDPASLDPVAHQRRLRPRGARADLRRPRAVRPDAHRHARRSPSTGARPVTGSSWTFIAPTRRPLPPRPRGDRR